MMKTDEAIAARGSITDGKWMFLVRHVDPAKKVNEEFEESVFVSMLAIEAR